MIYIGNDFLHLYGDQYIVKDNLTWEIGKKSSGLVVVIKKGFKFESSVPRFLWWAISPHNPHYLWAAAVHDWLLENNYRPAFAAGEWHDAAKSKHAPSWQRIPMFIIVSLFTIIRRLQGDKE